MTDLIGGQVDVMCDQSTNTSGQIKSGNIKAYGVTVDKRLGLAPRPADAGGVRPGRLRGRRSGTASGRPRERPPQR